MKEVMLGGDKDSVRKSAAEYVLDQRLGLKKPKATVNVFNIVDFNERLKEVKERRRQLEERTIEVEGKAQRVD